VTAALSGGSALRLLLVWLFLGAGTVPLAASSASALKAYAKGRFDEAIREYERLAEKHPDDARLRFNAGTAAYQAGDLTTATNHLTAATRSTDPLLLQNVYYNLGNAFYRLGEQAPAPPAAMAHWEQALQHYDSALKLDDLDGDARFNREWVAQRLEALKQQQQDQEPSSEPPPKREPSEAGRQAKAQADAAVIRKEYRRAYELMTALSESDQAYYADYLKRLQEVLGLVDPAGP
jgi:Ca-activated chloride channel family protein